MKKNIEQIFNNLKRESLTKREQNTLRGNLEVIMRKNPFQQKTTISPYAWFMIVREHTIVASFALLFIFGGGSSLLAEQALPGDIFYVIKKDVNEKIMGWFANSTDERAEWQLSLAERRLSEIGTLSGRSKLPIDLQDSLSAEVEFHTEQALGESVGNIIENYSFQPSRGFLKTPVDLSLELEEIPAESSFMMSALPDEDVFPDSPDSLIGSVDILISDIDDLLYVVEIQKQSFRKIRKESKDKRSIIQEWGHILVAEKLLFEAKTALLADDSLTALELFNNAKAILQVDFERAPNLEDPAGILNTQNEVGL